MWRRRVLLLLKPYDVYPSRRTDPKSSNLFSIENPKVRNFLDNRCSVHKETINFCQDVLRRKSLDWIPILRSQLSKPISDVDLVVTVGGDGTLLQASHFMHDTIPIVGVNSDPTQPDEVEKFKDEFDATRSTGHLCAAIAENFEQVLDEILEGLTSPIYLTRISISINGQLLSTHALNDVLLAHPSPATVSRFSFLLKTDGQKISSLIHSRSSGLRLSTATGSTAAMLSSGGTSMPVWSRDLQYMVREPSSVESLPSHSMHGLIGSNQSIQVTWYSEDGMIYIDGSHLSHSIKHGDICEISSNAPVLKVYLPTRLLP